MRAWLNNRDLISTMKHLVFGGLLLVSLTTSDGETPSTLSMVFMMVASPVALSLLFFAYYRERRGRGLPFQYRNVDDSAKPESQRTAPPAPDTSGGSVHPAFAAITITALLAWVSYVLLRSLLT